MISSRACFLALLLPAAVVACSSSSTSTGGLPEGVTCSGSTSAGDSATLTTALAGAKNGSCVVASAGTYTGSFTVPPGVALVSSSRASFSSDAKSPAITLGEGATLGGVDVTSAAGVGVAVLAGTATITDVHVTGTKNAALAVQCKEGAPCTSGTVSMKDVELTKSALGLWVSGAHVVWAGGRSAEHASTSLAAAFGVVAQSGAKLELTNVTVEKNEGTGILIDGDQTTATITDSNVQDNGERGVWAQKVNGTLDAPAVTIKGSNLVRNKIVGAGFVESHGIIIVGGRIAETIAAPVVTDLASTEQVGDGVGVFSSTNIKLDAAVLEANARAAGVIDHSETGIIIVGGRVAASASGLKIVVQNASSSADVQVPADAKSTSPALGISAPKLSLPPVF